MSIAPSSMTVRNAAKQPGSAHCLDFDGTLESSAAVVDVRAASMGYHTKYSEVKILVSDEFREHAIRMHTILADCPLMDGFLAPTATQLRTLDPLIAYLRSSMYACTGLRTDEHEDYIGMSELMDIVIRVPGLEVVTPAILGAAVKTLGMQDPDTWLPSCKNWMVRGYFWDVFPPRTPISNDSTRQFQRDIMQAVRELSIAPVDTRGHECLLLIVKEYYGTLKWGEAAGSLCVLKSVAECVMHTFAASTANARMLYFACIAECTDGIYAPVEMTKPSMCEFPKVIRKIIKDGGTIDESVHGDLIIKAAWSFGWMFVAASHMFLRMPVSTVYTNWMDAHIWWI
jgi:hypothetical protein